MEESKVEKLLTVIAPYFILCAIGFLALLLLVGVVSLFVDHENEWIRECAKHRPLVECRQDAKALEAQ